MELKASSPPTPTRALPSVLLRALAKASAQGRPGGQRIFVLQFTPCGVYVWLESQAEITNVSYRIDSAIAADRHSAAAERVTRRFVICFGSEG